MIFALMAWVLFDRGGTTSLVLTFMTVLFVVAVVRTWILSLVWKKSRSPDEGHSEATSFHDWRAGDFKVWGARLHGYDAAIDVLLPPIAVSGGLTAIGIVCP